MGQAHIFFTIAHHTVRRWEMLHSEKRNADGLYIGVLPIRIYFG